MCEIESTRENGLWLAFRAAAHARGLLSTLSLPMLAGDRAIGAMNLYSFTERAFSGPDREVGSVFAAQAAVVLANSQTYWDAHDESERLAEAMTSRAVIEQAKGMQIAAQHCDEEAAFEVLARALQ